MKNAILLLLILDAATMNPVAVAAQDNCLTCHQEFENEETGPSHTIARDVHIQKGLGCIDCHGGDAALDDMDEVRELPGWLGAPGPLDAPGFCARCHSDATYMHEHDPSLPTDQLAKYKTSIHGQRLYKQRDVKVANCVSCHGVHQIGDARMPHSSTHPLNLAHTCAKCHADAEYMAGYGIPTDQFEDYRRSVHGQALLGRKDLGAPACNDCHGNHGAAPPGVTSLSFVCGNCHAIQAELFNRSPHRAAFEENDFPMCETCHSHHLIEQPNDQMVGAREPALCVNCHSDDDGTQGLAVAAGMSLAIEKLAGASSEARTVLDDAVAKGMMTTDEEFRLKEVQQTLIATRTQVHAFALDTILTLADVGYDKAMEVRANSAALIDEYYFRRKGLGLATLFITVLVVGLWVYIRRLED